MAATELVWIDRTFTVIGAVGVFMMGVIFTQMYGHYESPHLRHNYENVIKLSVEEMNRTIELVRANDCLLFDIIQHLCGQEEESNAYFPELCHEEYESMEGFLHSDRVCAPYRRENDRELPLYFRSYAMWFRNRNTLPQIQRSMDTIASLHDDGDETILTVQTF